MRPRHSLGLFLAACQPAPVASTSFGSTPGITTAADSTSDASTTTSNSTSPDTSHGPGDGHSETISEPPRDLGGMPDFGDDSPVGCKGKIDFLFMISRQANMVHHQEQLASAFPQFIDTIQSKFADFDYHIMVVDGDATWGNQICNEICPDLACEVGESCCPGGNPADVGQPCCGTLDYPCDLMGLVSGCDTAWGAGTVFPAGNDNEANEPCPIDGGRRYLVKGQTNLDSTFECIANVGASGYMLLGQAMVAAVDPAMNKLGGCNPGFLREDALLMVTFIATNGDNKGALGSKGTPAEWAKAVVDAKHGDARSVVMFNIGFLDCEPNDPFDRLCEVTKMFPYHYLESVLVSDYGPAFDKAADLVETACAGFTPPPV